MHRRPFETQLTSQEESQTQSNIDRDSHVAVPSGESHPYATSKPSVASSAPETAVVAFTSGSAVRINPNSRMLRQAPFPEHMLGQAYLEIVPREKRSDKRNGLETTWRPALPVRCVGFWPQHMMSYLGAD